MRLAPVSDDNAVGRKISRKDELVFKCNGYIWIPPRYPAAESIYL